MPLRRVSLGKDLDFLDAEQVRHLNRLLKAPGQMLMAHQLVLKLRLASYEEGLQVLVVLDAKGVVESRILAYHRNHSELEPAAAAWPLREGVPKLPLACDECDSIVDDYEDLLFDIDGEVVQATKLERRE